LEDQLAIGSSVSLNNAKRIYEEGGHSKSVAKVTLSTPLTGSLAKFASVSGRNEDGGAVYGKVYDDYPNGSNQIMVQYKTTDNQASYVSCQVGGLPKPNLQGCLAASGTLSIDGATLSYTYNQKSDNTNKRTLQNFSTQAEDKMFRCENCPYPTYKKFREYYGFFDYADKWINAAFDGTGTNFARGNGECASNLLES
jgi:hypothetical protein